MFKTRRLKGSVILAAVLVGLSAPEHLLQAQSRPPQSQPQPPQPARPSQSGAAGVLDDALAAVSAWIERAGREYQSVVTNELSVPTEKAMTAGRATTPKPPAAPRAEPPAQSRPVAAAPAATGTETAQRPDQLPVTDQATRERQRAAEEERIARANGRQVARPAAAPERPMAPERTPVAPGAVADGSRHPQPAAPKVEPRAETVPPEAARSRADAASERPEPKVAVRPEPKPEPPPSPEPRHQAAAPPPSPQALSDAASKAGNQILKSLEEPPPAKAKGEKSDKGKVVVVAKEEPARDKATRSAGRDRCKDAGRKVEPPAYYTVKRGDNLWRISLRHYQKGIHYYRIVRANASKISDPDLIYPCQRFFLPG